MNEALKNARVVRRWTHEKTATRAGITRSLYTLTENGRVPSLRTAYKIAEALGERVDEIFLPSYVLNQKQIKED
jgi:DNA-binding XRE family transcriptional regulator